jgi:hypothetical protein
MPSYVRRRGRIWFFRWKFPRRLAGADYTGELVRSLKTSDFQLARRRAALIVLRIEVMTTSHPLPDRKELESSVRRWIDNCVWRQEVRRAETNGIAHFDLAEIERMGEAEARELDGLFRFGASHFAEHEKSRIGSVLQGGASGESLRPIVEAAAQEIGVSADPSTVAGRLAERTILRGYATLLDELRETVGAIPREPTSPPSPLTPAQPASFAFTEHWEAFEEHKISVREWQPETASNARGSRAIFDRIFPGVTVAELVTEPIAPNFQRTLLELPNDCARQGSVSKTIRRLIETAKNLPLTDRMQPGTVNKHVGNLSEYWAYLVTQKKLPAELKNPFKGLHLQKPRGRKARDERHNWPPTLERQLFESPLYIGCGSIHRRSRTGEEIHRDALFWMPLLARTMGTRENEICDALVGSIQIAETGEGPIAYLAITVGKDSGSARDVPFADLVLDMGFLEQRYYGRDPAEPLFPELIPQGPGMRRSAAFSDRFSYYRRAIGVHRPRIDFHSFRGNVETDLKNNLQAFSVAWIDELIGHESLIRRSEGERYTKKIALPILRGLVNSIEIQGTFDHLRYEGERCTASPTRDAELRLFVALAEREMRKKRKQAPVLEGQ